MRMLKSAFVVGGRATRITMFVIALVVLGGLGSGRKAAAEGDDETFREELAEVERLRADTQFYPAMKEAQALQEKYTEDKARAKKLRQMVRRLHKERMRTIGLFSQMEKLGHEYVAV
ncbi:MAG: hypothetical protein KAJ01_10840 [Candidatus Hydrogenedentes bacterium]|nr:hypothetical protein [Candidatus Hydrogenedentota bacterium]